MKQYSKECFIESMGASNWTDILNTNDVDDVDVDKIPVCLGFPIKHKQIKQNTAKWITHSILEVIRQRDNALIKFKGTSQQQY